MAEMKAQRVFPLRMPTCHSFFHPGDNRDLGMSATPAPLEPGCASAYHFSSEFEYLNLNMASSSST